jgi:hypothetical protein
MLTQDERSMSPLGAISQAASTSPASQFSRPKSVKARVDIKTAAAGGER